tara:strand:+ start:11101 stop:11871 length:771 start_codon:yes stop_codon:yes gene_type:complete
MKKINHKLHVNKIKKNGYTIIKNFLSITELSLIKNKIKKIENQKSTVKTGNNIWHLHNYDEIFTNVICKKDIQKILIPLLNDPFYKNINLNLPNYILGESMIIDEKGFMNLHLDSYIPSSSSKLYMANVLFLLDDRSRDNACTILIKNTHRKDSYPDRNKKNYTYLEGKKGDLIIYDSRIWHGRCEAKTNTSNRTLVYIVQSWFIKQRFDYIHLLPKKIFKKLSNLEKQFLGFCSIPPKDNKKIISIRQGYEVLKN